MRHLITTAIYATLLLSAEVFGAARVGQPAPDFNGALSNGATVSLPALRGQTSALAQLASGDKVNPAVTRPYGCSVKYR